MKLYDFGATVLILALLFGGYVVVKKYHPATYAAGVKVLSGINAKYIDHHRTPASDIDNDPVFEAK